MAAEELLRKSFSSVEVNADYTEAVLMMRDGSSLVFRHRVGERWAKAAGPGQTQGDTTLAGQVLAMVSLFRLNPKHLDVQFGDGSRWEARFGDLKDGRPSS